MARLRERARVLGVFGLRDLSVLSMCPVVVHAAHPAPTRSILPDIGRRPPDRSASHRPVGALWLDLTATGDEL